MSIAGLVTVPREHPTVSFELYPPRTPAGVSKVQQTVAELAAVEPDFFSITYGAAGKSREASRGLIRHILTHTDVTPIAHLTCVGASERDLREVITDLLGDGVRDFLALRGDPPAGEAGWCPHPHGLTRASDLVRLLRDVDHEHAASEASHGPLSICVACYPGGDQDLSGAPVVCRDDVAALVEKQDAGADFAITQLFFDVGNYVELVQLAREAGVHIPILPGVIPVTTAKRLRRIHELTEVPIPETLLADLDGASDPAEAYRIGLRASEELLLQILDAGAPGVHIYTFNASRPALDLLQRTGLRPSRIAT